MLAAIGAAALLSFMACVGDDPTGTSAPDGGGAPDAPVADAPIDPTDDAGNDASDAGEGCSPNGVFGTPVVIPELDGLDVPRMTGDELLVLADSTRETDAGGDYNMWFASRASRSQPFGAPSLVPETPDSGIITTPEWELDPSMTANGTKIIWRQHSPAAGRPPGIYVAIRSDRNKPFDPPIEALTTTATDGGAIPQVFRRYTFIVPDGSAAYMTANYGPTDVALERWTRKVGTEMFTDPVVVTGLGGAEVVVTDFNETRIFYRNALVPESIWTASRASKSDPWGDAHPISELTFPGSPVVPGAISLDGCRLYFFRTGAGGRHILMATRGK